ncbi:MAG: hypothetical protein Q8O42_17595 [Acidobacteriota bacterium]|nr:hypothetical protein [Acidobacteriota bacterium]
MRTTIDIPDALYRRLKARAAAEGQPAKTFILRAVEQAMDTPQRARRRIVIPVIPSKQPGTLRLDNAQIYDLLFSS